VIVLTRLNGQPVMLNCDLIESVEQNGETIITLTTGNAVVVREPLDEIERRVVAFKRKINAPREADSS
jgi:flagellar protein FlbD